MKKYLCKTTWKQWDEFLESHTTERAEKIICADSKSEAEDEFIQSLIDQNERKENPWRSIFAQNSTVKLLRR